MSSPTNSNTLKNAVQDVNVSKMQIMAAARQRGANHETLRRHAQIQAISASWGVAEEQGEAWEDAGKYPWWSSNEAKSGG